MARQSPTNPRFRCNGCKDYYSAPEHNVHYQCAKHGYLCKKHISKKNNVIGLFQYWYGFDGKVVKHKIATPNLLNKCLCWKDPKKNVQGDKLPSAKAVLTQHKGDRAITPISKYLCLKDPVKFNWHEDVGRWIEKGKEKEEKAKAQPKAKSKTKPDYVSEIKVLMDLFEKDILTKEQFLSQLKEKLGL